MEEYDPDASTTSVREVLSYRQRLEKPAGGEIVLMKWSPTMDLLAATFADKSVRYAASSLCCMYTTQRPAPWRKTLQSSSAHAYFAV